MARTATVITPPPHAPARILLDVNPGRPHGQLHCGGNLLPRHGIDGPTPCRTGPTDCCLRESRIAMRASGSRLALLGAPCVPCVPACSAWSTARPCATPFLAQSPSIDSRGRPEVGACRLRRAWCPAFVCGCESPDPRPTGYDKPRPTSIASRPAAYEPPHLADNTLPIQHRYQHRPPLQG